MAPLCVTCWNVPCTPAQVLAAPTELSLLLLSAQRRLSVFYPASDSFLMAGPLPRVSRCLEHVHIWCGCSIH
jgi:hypothetical protein